MPLTDRMLDSILTSNIEYAIISWRMNLSRKNKEILIASLTPYFLERAEFWFSQNFAKIKSLAQTQVWWRENTVFLEIDQRINLFELLRRLTDMGYERVQTLGAKGELAQRGGILDIFPINAEHAWRLEFTGNSLAEIFTLEIKALRKDEEIKKSLLKRAAQSLLSSLKPDEFVVHLDHGIGVFKGYATHPGGQLSLSQPTPQSSEKFLVIEYAKSDKLYVPLALEEKLSRYIGFETPIVHRLGGTLWYNTKRKVKASAIETAQQLFEIYSRRAASRGFKFPVDDALQKELEDSFEYIETDDQLRVLRDVKKDMESEKPMDRLICGDVGFGKTEVALRAAFKAVAAGKQVAILTPTTILAHQHSQTFLKRLKKFPINIALLSRLESKKEQKETIKKIKENKIDIAIGTHRLIQKDVEFSNLGLVIIDEEQRFGVKQKEKFKEWRAGVDVLSLSATPIPRTMHLALSGLRDISLIQTAPPGRLPVKTIIEPYSQKTVKGAIEKEIERGGQVYYLHNRVETIELVKRQIEKLLNIPSPPMRGGVGWGAENRTNTTSPLSPPQLRRGGILPRVAIAHGRMNEKQLIKVMDEFGAGQIDILIATTIIENGLDFPNVNTLIVDNATKLGLAQSYQIRGRIGRSNRQAYSYFLYNVKLRPQAPDTTLLPNDSQASGRNGIPHRKSRAQSGQKGLPGAWTKNLTDITQQRLDALKEAEALGSGYQIALRDLEIRGAGNILGREQSGSINAVGLNLYVQMLNEAVEEMKK